MRQGGGHPLDHPMLCYARQLLRGSADADSGKRARQPAGWGALGAELPEVNFAGQAALQACQTSSAFVWGDGQTWLEVDTVTSQHERPLLPAGPPLCGCSQPALPAVAHLTAAPPHSLIWQQLVALCCVPASIRSPMCVLTVAACIVTAGADPAKSCCPCWSSCRR